MISEDVENVSEDTDDNDEELIDENYDLDSDSTGPQNETKYHYCWIKNLDILLYDQNKQKCKTYFCNRCLHGFKKEDLLIKHEEDYYGINTNSTIIEMPMKGTSHITLKTPNPNARSICHLCRL